MNTPINQDEFNRILLKPRFKFKYSDSKKALIDCFEKKLKSDDCDFPSKIVGHHIVIDVPDEEDHFWSPQLHVEVEDEDDHTVVKGILGPKPRIWTFFIFLHFAVAVTFFVFFVIFYTRWSLDQDYSMSLTICILMPVLWVVLYFVGQLGKKFGYDQMVRLNKVLIEALEGKNKLPDE